MRNVHFKIIKRRLKSTHLRVLVTTQIVGLAVERRLKRCDILLLLVGAVQEGPEVLLRAMQVHDRLVLVEADLKKRKGENMKRINT
jgi:hypothetical protein